MTDWKNRITKIWAADPGDPTGAPGFLTAGLSLLALPYGVAVAARNAGYDWGILKRHRLPSKVVSVGNLSVGGTGKTPTTILVANLLKDAGHRPAILSRGYGGKKPADVNVVSDGKNVLLDPEEGGDEPVLLAQACPGIPVIAGVQRKATGAFAVDRFGADVLILDDGFQHRSLYRDIDIVLVDGRRPFGNGFLLPRGPLREPAAALNRSDIIVKTGLENDAHDDDGKGLLRVDRPVFLGRRTPKAFIFGKDAVPLETLKGKTVGAFAGIAVPDSFKILLERSGIRVAVWIPFPDHHRYTEKDVADIQRTAGAAAVDAIVTTEKDGVKLWKFEAFLKNTYLLKIVMDIEPPDALKTILLNKLREHQN